MFIFGMCFAMFVYKDESIESYVTFSTVYYLNLIEMNKLRWAGVSLDK